MRKSEGIKKKSYVRNGLKKIPKSKFKFQPRFSSLRVKTSRFKDMNHRQRKQRKQRKQGKITKKRIKKQQK